MIPAVLTGIRRSMIFGSDFNNMVDDLYTAIAGDEVLGNKTFEIVRTRTYYGVYDGDRTPTQETEEVFTFYPVQAGKRMLDREKTGAGSVSNLSGRAVIPITAASPSLTMDAVKALLAGGGELTSDIAGSGLMETVKCFVDDQGISINSYDDPTGNQLVIDYTYDRN